MNLATTTHRMLKCNANIFRIVSPKHLVKFFGDLKIQISDISINTMKLFTPFSIPKSDMTALPKRKNKATSKKSH